MTEMLTLGAFEEASKKVKEVTLETKLIESPYLSEATGNQVWLKPENMQRTGAYKLRGAYYKISKMTKEELGRGVITASAGNHAQGVAYAASQAGVRAVVVMPTTTPLIKVERTKGYGAEVVLFGDVFDEAQAHAMELSQTEGLTYIPPFNDTTVATGQGTIGMEIVSELPLVDTILVPVGGGGLACGVSTFAKLYNPKIKVIGVEPVGAASLTAALKEGHVVKLSGANTIADGTAVLAVGDKVFPYLQQNLDDVITVDDSELIDCFLDVGESHKLVVEPSGLLTVAALKHLPAEDKHVVSVLSGGNVDVITMASVLQYGLVRRGRIFTISIKLPNRPGTLIQAADNIAEANGNIIKIDHDQLVNSNRNVLVEVKITIEAFGTEHKEQIINSLKDEGFDVTLIQPAL